MSIQVLYNADILLDGVAASTEFSKIKLSLNQEAKQKTAFGDVARNFLPGVYAASAEGECYFQMGAAFSGSKLELLTDGPTPGTFVPMIVTLAPDQVVGNLTYLWKSVMAKFEEAGDHGEVLKATVGMEASYRNVQANRLIRQPSSGTSGLGTAVLLGAVAAGQSLYSALHVLASTGGAAGTIFSIVSSATSSLTAPTTRITFAQGTSALAGEWQEVVGPITDTWWAAKWTGFAGTSTFTVSISAGIQQERTMSVQVIYNAAILVNGIDLSNRCFSLKVNFGQETKEKTAMGDVARNSIAGLATPSIEATFYLDRASGSVIQTLRPLIGVTVANFPVVCRWQNSAATTSNEVYTMTACINGGIDVISGAVGDVEKIPVKFACGSGTGIAVATTS